MRRLEKFSMKQMFGKICLLVFCLFLLIPLRLQARDVSEIADWYIKDFKTEIIVNEDSSLEITEKIVADCGNLPNKHGIYRILPTQVYATDKSINTPIKLESITDSNGSSLKYSESQNRADHTITWKIGDPDKTVTGENFYQIKYKVQNAIRFDSESFDEFYWNLNGDFWEIETDSFSAEITFPGSIDEANTGLSLYTGTFGSQNQDATVSWISKNVLAVSSTKHLKAGEGITLSVAVPKGIFTAYTPSFWEKYGHYFSFLLPLLTLVICFWLWAKNGRDPKVTGPVVPEFEIPGKLSPMELGEVMTNGKLHSQYISAGIVNLAVEGYLKINQLEKNDYKLTRLKEVGETLGDGEKILLGKLFGGKKEILLSDLKNEFYEEIGSVEAAVKPALKKDNLIKDSGTCSQIVFIVLAIIFGFGAVATFDYEILLSLNFILGAAILIIFVFLIPKRTVENAKMLKKIEGFKLYMKTAEKYRQQFNERENIFEKYLPYAMIFGLTGLWVSKMKEIYGEEYFSNYHPVWFYGASIASFNADSLNSAISSLSSHMSSTLASSPSSSGSGGGGFSGGGGGGGGGGGW